MDKNIKLFIAAEKKEVNEKERTIVAWASKPIIDRHNELIMWNAWDTKAFEKNRVLLVAHNYSGLPAGKVLWVRKTKEGLKFKAEFAETELGDELFYLYTNDFMNAFSVGFIPKKQISGEEIEKGDEGYGADVIYKNVELLEISCVSVPACSEALATAYKNDKIHTKTMIDILEKEKIIIVDESKTYFNSDALSVGTIQREFSEEEVKEIKELEKSADDFETDCTELEEIEKVPEEADDRETDLIERLDYLIKRIEKLETELFELKKKNSTETELELTDNEDDIIEIIESEEIDTEETEIKVSDVLEEIQREVGEYIDTKVKRQNGKVLVRE